METQSQTWNAKFYDSNHAFNSKFGETLIPWLNPIAGEKIADIGCGTGDLTQKIAVLGARVMGIDSSPTMIAEAKRKYPKLDFQINACQNLGYSEEFDAIFSNAALHWVKEAQSAAKSMANALKPGGRLVVEFGGGDNIKHIVSAINSALDNFGYPKNKEKNPWFFPTVAQYCNILESEGLIIRDLRYFDRPTALDDGEKGLQNWIKMFGAAFFEGIPNAIYQQILIHIDHHAQKFLWHDGHWIADYKRLRIKAEKPKNEYL